MSDLDIHEKEIQLAADFAVMDIKLDILKIMLKFDIPEMALDAIKEYITGEDKDGSS